MKIRSCSVKSGIKLNEPQIKSLSDVMVIAVENPDKIYVPTKMMKGITPSIIVSRGDEVKIGTRLAVGGKNTIVSPVSGVVEGIVEVPSVYGGTTSAVVIENNFLETREQFPKFDLTNASTRELLDALGEVSIVDYDGRTLLNKINSIKSETSTPTIIINLLTDEFYQQTNLLVVKEKLDDCVVGVKALVKILDAQKVVIAVGKTKRNLYQEFEQKLGAELFGVETEAIVVDEKFPVGDETEIVKLYTKSKLIKNTTDCIKAGVAAFDVFSLYALKKLLVDGETVDLRPVSIIEKDKTIKTYNSWIKIGARLSDVANALMVNGLESVTKLVAGGFFRGLAQSTPNAGWTLALKGIVLIKEKLSDQPVELGCISCGKCKAVCPVKIDPSEIDAKVEDKDISEAIRLGAIKCTKCGCCSYVCPSKRNLTQRIYSCKQDKKGKTNEQ